MSKELEILEHLRKGVQYINQDESPAFISQYEEDLDKIENALIEYEMEHTLRIRLENINYELVREKQENEKKLKALEIIKEKKVDISWFYISKTTEDYNRNFDDYKDSWREKYILTQEEYDLLKEVLL